MRKLLGWLVWAALVGIGSGPALGQPVFDLGDVVVTADLDEEFEIKELLDQPISATVIRREEFAERAGDLAGLLARTAGVETRSYGGLGSFSTVTVRGAASNQVQILLDGLPLNQALGGAVNLGDIPLDNVQRIEVYRGHAPARFRTAGIGGAVNIVTRRTRAAHFNSRLSIGSFGAHSQSFNYGFAAHDDRYLINFVNEGADNDFKFIDDRRTPLNPADDIKTTRRNAGFKAQNFLFKADWELGAGRRLILKEEHFRKTTGVPGLGAGQSRNARLTLLRNLVVLGFTDYGVFGGDAALEARFESAWQRSAFQDPMGEIGIAVKQDNRNHTLQNSFTLALDAFVGARHNLYLSLTRQRESYDPKDYLNPMGTVGRKSRRESWALALQDSIRLMGERLLITPVYRWERLESRFAGPDPFDFSPLAPGRRDTETLHSGYIGVRYRIRRELALKFNYGKYFRAPGFYELFGDMGSALGNTGLDSESGRNLDLGLVYNAPRLGGLESVHLELNYFHNRSRNLITYIQNSQYTARAVNIGAARISGLEFIFDLGLGNRWRLSGNYTRQQAVDRSQVSFLRGNRLPNRHEHDAAAALDWFFDRGRVFVELQYLSHGYLDRANLMPIPDRRIYGAGVNCEFADRWSATIEARNIGDNRVADMLGFPLPGRMFFLTVNRN